MTDAKQPFDRLYDEHFEAIFRYVLRRVANVPEAEDLTAQTFYKALRRYWRFRWSGGSASAWLYRIATNEVNSHYRSQRSSAAEEPPVTASGDAESTLAVQQLYVDLHQALRELDLDDQALIVLRYFEHKTYDEIAPILKRRPGALAMRNQRALKKLENRLRQRGIDHEELRGILAPVERTRPSVRDIPAQAAP